MSQPDPASSPATIIAALETVLAEERRATIAFDTARVAALTEEKDQLVRALRAFDKMDVGLVERLGEIVRSMRVNAMLIAHARDVLRERLQGTGPGARVSVHG